MDLKRGEEQEKALSSIFAMISARTNFVVSQCLFVVAEFVGHLQASILFPPAWGVCVAGAPELCQIPLFFHPGCMFVICAHGKQIVNKLLLYTDSQRAFYCEYEKVQ